MTTYGAPSRTDDELRVLLRLLVASDGFCGDPLLRRELIDTGFARPDPTSNVVLHLTPEGRRFVHTAAVD